MKKCLKIVLSLALVLALAGSLSGTVFAHSGHHVRRAKMTRRPVYTASWSDVTDAADTASPTPAAALEAVPEQGPATEPAYAACYENGYCTGNNLCDVNGVCQNGGICNGAACNASCSQDGTCLQNGSYDINGICQNGGTCYGSVSQNRNTDSGSYGHHGGGHHGGRRHH